MKQPSALALSAQTAAIMMAFALVFTALMAGTYLATRPAIEKSSAEEKLRLINAILDPSSYDNALLEDIRTLGPTPALGLADGGHIWRARKAGKPVALVLETIAPDGYSGRIHLIVAVLADGRVGGVRVTQHKETPGLGDYIDPQKDRNKSHPFIRQFEGHSLDSRPLERWRVRKDGGDFEFVTGATISARAVTEAAGRALAYVQQQGNVLYE